MRVLCDLPYPVEAQDGGEVDHHSGRDHARRGRLRRGIGTFGRRGLFGPSGTGMFDSPMVVVVDPAGFRS